MFLFSFIVYFALLFSEPSHWGQCGTLSNVLSLNLTFQHSYILEPSNKMRKDLSKYGFSDGKYTESSRLKEKCMFTICGFDGKWCFLICFSSCRCIANDIMILNPSTGAVLIGCDGIIERRSPVARKCHDFAAPGDGSWQFATSSRVEDV